MERLRRHIYAFLRPELARPQPYMTFLTDRSGACAASALSGMHFVPIAHSATEQETETLEQRTINTEHPPLNVPYVTRLMAGISSLRHHRVQPRLVVSLRASSTLARFKQLRPRTNAFPPLTSKILSTPDFYLGSFAHWAAAACNQLGKPLSGAIRKDLFSLSPNDWIGVWQFIRRRMEGIPRHLGLIFMDRVRKFRGWPRPTLSIVVSLPWLPSSCARSSLKDMLVRLVCEAQDQGRTLLLPQLRDLKLGVVQVPVASMRKVLRNAPAYYRRLGDHVPWKCVCSKFPGLPRLPSPDGKLMFSHLRTRGTGQLILKS